MRVMAGTAKGRILRSPRSRDTRPITDRAKESLFGILGDRIPGSRFLDLFAGTGGVGIEALSRGCAHATFVERSAGAVAVIRHNLAVTHLAAGAEVVAADVFRYLRGDTAPFGVIFVAPPQWLGLWPRAVQLLDRQPGWLAPERSSPPSTIRPSTDVGSSTCGSPAADVRAGPLQPSPAGYGLPTHDLDLSAHLATPKP
jgi:16S rRNA (guanine(966)-N(2))-methyltransferase RsmD